MELPVIDFSELDGDKRSETMALLHQACEKWGFFQIENHGMDKQVMEHVKLLLNQHYENNLKERFYLSEIATEIENGSVTSSADWEARFSFGIVQIRTYHMETYPMSSGYMAMDAYIDQLIKLAEQLSELMCENLGLEKDQMKKAFSGSKGPSIGTKVAIYPKCPRPELITGLREHTGAGGIILLLQDDQVPGLEFFNDGKWVKIPPSKNNTMFINIGDQIEVLSNGRYKSILHRVLVEKDGNRLSVATFYNPAGDAIISPASKMLYPENYGFEDYLKLYGTTKFREKGERFELMKKMPNAH